MFFFKAEGGIRDVAVTGVQTCALPTSAAAGAGTSWPTGRGRRSQVGGALAAATRRRAGARSRAGRREPASVGGTAGETPGGRSAERRLGYECRSGTWSSHYKSYIVNVI